MSENKSEAFFGKNSAKGAAVAAGLYLALCMLSFSPVLFGNGEVLYGKIGDATSSAWLYWTLGNSGFSGTALVNFPEGINLASAHGLPAVEYVLVPLTHAVGALNAYNLYSFLALFLSLLSMFFLARHFLKDNASSFITGLVFGFCPYLVMKSTGHLTLAFAAAIPLFVLALFKFKERPSLKSGIILGFCLFLVPFFESYYFYFSLLFCAIFALYFLHRPFIAFVNSGKLSAFNSLKKFFIPALAGIAVFAVLFLLIVFPLYFQAASGFGSGLGAQGLRASLYNVIYFSAKPVQFLVPSVYNPFLGSIALDIIPNAASSDFAEGTVYAGFSVIALSLFALYFFRREKSVKFLAFAIIALLALMQGPLVRYVGVFGIAISFIPIMLALWLCWLGKKRLALAFIAATVLLALVPLLYGLIPQAQSLAYGVTGIEQLKAASPEKIISYLERFDYLPIPMPSLLLFKIVPYFRVYERLDVFLMLCLALLAGFGVKAIAGMQRQVWKKHAVIIAALVIIGLEFSFLMPARTTQMLPLPPEYEWLSAQPEGTSVAEYPLSAFPYYSFYQQYHGKPLFNSPDLGAGLSDKSFLTVLDQQTIYYLRGRGLDYLIVHSDFSQLYSSEFPDQQYFLEKEFSGSQEAIAVRDFASGEGYKSMKGIKLVQVFGKTLVFKLE